MSAADQAADWCRAHGYDFSDVLNAHLAHGYVFATPEVFLMGRPVRSDATGAQISDIRHAFADPDCWFIWLLTGRVNSFLWTFEPFSLPFVAWARRGQIRVHPMATVHARCTSNQSILITPS